MPKVIISMEGVVIKEVELSKERTSLGRRPYNDVVIDNLAISGEHAVLQLVGQEVSIEDLNSTNGTYVNGKSVKKQLLQHSDVIEIGKYHIQYFNELPPSPPEGIDATSTGTALIRVMSGSAVGREVALLKVVTTIGKPGIAVAAITKRPHGFVLAHVEGAKRVTLNRRPVGDEPMAMKNGDVIELAGTQMEFLHY
ncbi:MAG: FHA domain-containing protein [Polaromonas sp.]|nr:FHA domain-containing protein [Polaromonas sp.]